MNELRAWAKKCADVTRGRMPEFEIWDAIADRGEEWQIAYTKSGKPDHGGPLMTPRECYTNTARAILGLTAYNPDGKHYAEGFALTNHGMWSHHAWIVNEAGLVVDRTWKDGAQRYVGVICDDWLRMPGEPQLSDWPCGFAWAPTYADSPELLDRMFRESKVTVK